MATRPDEKWVADFTYLRTWNGFVYLAFILDCYSRKIVGWQIATHMRHELVLDALEMANGLRRPEGGLIAHSDRGLQTGALPTPTVSSTSASIPPSEPSGTRMTVNAMAEAWVATYKTELVHGRRFPGFEHAEHAEHETLAWIGFYG